MTGSIVIGGSLAQRPGVGGHTWVFLQFLLGFRRLGWEVLFLDRLEPSMCLNMDGQSCALEESVNLQYTCDIMRQFGLEDSFALLYDGGRECIGRSRADVMDRVRQADLFLNVMGFIDHPDVLGTARRRVFLDIDPGFGQMWRDLGLHDLFTGYDDLVTIGLNIGRPFCDVPTCGLTWIVMPQPVVLHLWPPAFDTSFGPLTSVVSWRGAFGPIEYGGRIYGLRVHEFRKFVELPFRTGHPCTLALDIHEDETADIELLRSNGWSLAAPRDVAGDPIAYQTWIQRSGAEFMVAKSMYVATASGWLSDRTICYLASGKPALVQDTGLSDLFPTGTGLLTFSTLDEAVFGVEELKRDYTRHAREARAIAEAHFDSDTVLTRLLHALGAQ